VSEELVPGTFLLLFPKTMPERSLQISFQLRIFWRQNDGFARNIKKKILSESPAFQYLLNE